MASKKRNRTGNQPVKSQESRQEELRRKYQRIWNEKMEQQKERLENLDVEQNQKRVLYAPYVCVLVVGFVMLLLWLVGSHCYVDVPLLIVLFGVTIILALLTIYKNRELCQRIRDMRAERGENP